MSIPQKHEFTVKGKVREYECSIDLCDDVLYLSASFDPCGGGWYMDGSLHVFIKGEKMDDSKHPYCNSDYYLFESEVNDKLCGVLDVPKGTELVCLSEAGRQGDDFVDFDIFSKFCVRLIECNLANE